MTTKDYIVLVCIVGIFGFMIYQQYKINTYSEMVAKERVRNINQIDSIISATEIKYRRTLDSLDVVTNEKINILNGKISKTQNTHNNLRTVIGELPKL